MAFFNNLNKICKFLNMKNAKYGIPRVNLWKLRRAALVQACPRVISIPEDLALAYKGRGGEKREHLVCIESASSFSITQEWNRLVKKYEPEIPLYNFHCK